MADGRSQPALAVAAAVLLQGLVTGCRSEPDLTLQPDSVLQATLGLQPHDRVYRVTISGGEVERADPAALSIEAGSYVEFVSTDWLVHEILFDTASLTPAQRGFLRDTDQVHSPPLIDRGSRYVLSFVDATPGVTAFALKETAGPLRARSSSPDPSSNASARASVASGDSIICGPRCGGAAA